MWSLRPSYNTSILTYDTVLVLAFLNETKILACDEDTGELGEMDLDDGNRGVIGFAVDETSLLCANVFWDMVIQVNRSGVEEESVCARGKGWRMSELVCVMMVNV